MRVTSHETVGETEVSVTEGGHVIVLRAARSKGAGGALEVWLDRSEIDAVVVAAVKARAERGGNTSVKLAHEAVFSKAARALRLWE